MGRQTLMGKQRQLGLFHQDTQKRPRWTDIPAAARTAAASPLIRLLVAAYLRQRPMTQRKEVSDE